MSRRRLPDHDPPFSAAERTAIVREAGRLQKRHKVSNARLAAILDCSAAVWSQVRGGKYAGDTDAYLARALRWVRDRADWSGPAEPAFAETSIARRILAVCERAWRLPAIGLVVTPAGCGKTIALAEYARRHPGRAMHVSLGPCSNTARGILEEIAERLGVAWAKRDTTGDLARGVRRRLAVRYAGGVGGPLVLLLDETTEVSPAVIRTLRAFHDDPTCRLGLVLAGTEELDSQLARRNWVPGGTAQLRRRVRAAYRLGSPPKIARADVRAVTGALLEGMGLGGAEPPAEAWKYLEALARCPGAFGNLEARLLAVRDAAAGAGTRPTFSEAEIDYIGPDVGQSRRYRYRECPFGLAPKDQAAAVVAA